LNLSADFANTPEIARLSRIVTVSVAPAAAVTAPVTAFDLTGWSPMHAAFDLTGWAPPRSDFPDPRTEVLGAGLSNHSDLPLDAAGVFKGCTHFQNSFVNHGKGQSQGLWMQTVLASTWFQDGRKIAHTLSKGYPTYTREETNAMFDRKMRERAERGLGWPGCKAFEAEGAKCKSCPLYGKIRSPLNLAFRVASADPPDVAHQPKAGTTPPVSVIRTLRQANANREVLFAALNETFAVVRYGREVLIASILGLEVLLMEAEDFHKMFGNVRFKEGKRQVEVSRLWLEWPRRREYLGRGVVFEPGGPLEVEDDMLNLWRGYGLEPKQGDWSLFRSHIFNVVCSGRRDHFEYLIRWSLHPQWGEIREPNTVNRHSQCQLRTGG
jgi:hypothetical protein